MTAYFDGRAEQRRLHTGFLESARHHPRQIALMVGDRHWTYGEAEEIARRWAAALISALDRPPRRVGILGQRSEVSYLGVLATLFAGGTFVPLNRNFPAERTQYMVETAGLDAIFVDEVSMPQCRALLDAIPGVPCIVAPETNAPGLKEKARVVLGRNDLLATPPLVDLPVVGSDSVAYLLFTSGSTGRPKGVPITHANGVHFLTVAQQRYQLTHTDRLTQTFDQTFDLSIFDLFMAWNQGAAVCSMQPIEMLSPFRFVTEKAITVWFSVPTTAMLLRKMNLLKPGSLPSLRWSLFCGEALPQSTAEAWQAAAPNSILENLYGPTELTIACASSRWDPVRSPVACVNGLVPVGHLHSGLHGLVVDEQLQPVAPGEPGELCVAGPQTFPGYWNAPDLTAARTFTQKGPDKSDMLYYRTGDRVRWTEQGGYVFLGRTDFQVKINGYRVELGEVETVLRSLPGVLEAVALGWPVEDGAAKGIVAFVTGPQVPEASPLLEVMRAKLPAYMAPRAVHVVETLPLNANGKIDRNALSQRLAQHSQEEVTSK